MKKFTGIAILIILIVIAVGIMSHSQTNRIPPTQSGKNLTPVENSMASTTNIACQTANDTLPDPKCTPGAADPRVTQDNIDSTICVPGYTKTVRPPVSVTEPQKLESMKAYGIDDSPSNYEFDHLIPLEVGGAPDDMKNLWPESHDSSPNSYDKDKFENYLHAQVCSGALDLKTAQDEISSNWTKYWEEAGRPEG